MNRILNVKISLLSLPVLIAIVIMGMAPSLLLAGQHVVTSLPDTVYQSEHSADLWDTINLSGNLTSTVGGLVLNGSIDGNPPRYWLIDMGGDTINFGTNDGNSLYGVRITGGSSTRRPRYIIIQNGTILHKPAHSRSSDTSIVRDNTCLNLIVDDLKVINVNMMADGYNGKCVVGATGYNIEFSGGHYTSLVNYFRSRCQMDALIMGFSQTYDAQFASDSGFSYCQKIHGLRMDSIPHMGIRLDGGDYGEYGIFKIYDCTLMVDSRNFTYPGWGSTCQSSANPYGIAIQFAGPGSEVYNNVITSGTNYNGGRGILVEGSVGTSSTNVLIHHNYINVNEGPNSEYAENNVENHALRIRNDGIYQHIYNNTVINTGDNDINTDAYAKAISALRYTFGDLSREIISHNKIENNLFKCTALTTGVTAYGVCFDAVTVPDTTLIFRYNKIQSTNIIAKFGEVNTDGAAGITMIGDTFRFLSPTYNPQTTVVGHLNNNWDCSDNAIRDGVFENGASDTNIIFSTTTTGTLELGLQRLFNVYIRGRNGLAVQSASVSVTNNYGQLVLSGLTNITGYLDSARPVIYWWESRTTTDSMNFNNFSIKAKMGSDSTILSYAMTSTSTYPTIVLSNTDGGGTPADTIPPEKIDNLGAATGLSEGEVVLVWTAPGDDSIIGSAESYEIKYYKNLISESNWNIATKYSNAPDPGQPGTTQSLTIGGLTPGQRYYFAIKAADEVPNFSDISNAVSAKAQVDLTLDIDDYQAAIVSPSDRSTINSAHPKLSVKNINSESNNYHFEVSLDSNFIVPAAASPPIPQEPGKMTSWKVDARLNPNQTYFWRARANEYEYSDIYSFVVEPLVHAYPNPFKPVRDHQIIFTELPKSSNLIITSVSGNAIRHWNNIIGGELAWDGTNDSGYPVGAGAYLWYLKDSEYNGKIILIR
jgi:hypothetical protein